MRYREMEGFALRDLVLLGLGPHEGHDGIPGAPEGAYCARCRAERALAELMSRHAPEPWPSLARLSCGHFSLLAASSAALVEPGNTVVCSVCELVQPIAEIRW